MVIDKAKSLTKKSDLVKLSRFLVPRVGLEPTMKSPSTDFESAACTNSAIEAIENLIQYLSQSVNIIFAFSQKNLFHLEGLEKLINPIKRERMLSSF